MSESKQNSSRRDFLKMAGSFAAGAAIVGATVVTTQPSRVPTETETLTETATVTGWNSQNGSVRLFQLEYFAQQYLNAPNAFCVADRRHQKSIKTTKSGASRRRPLMEGRNRTRPLALGPCRSIKPLHTPSEALSMQPVFLRSESPETSIHG